MTTANLWGCNADGAQVCRLITTPAGAHMPSLGLPAWREIPDGAAGDGANTVILWMGGAFRSRKFPVTWQWVRDHENVKADFGRELIEHALGGSAPNSAVSWLGCGPSPGAIAARQTRA